MNLKKSVFTLLCSTVVLLSVGTTAASATPAETASKADVPYGLLDPSVETKYIAQCHGGKTSSCDYLARYYLKNHRYRAATDSLQELCYANSSESEHACAALIALYADAEYEMRDLEHARSLAKFVCEKKERSNGCVILASLYFTEDQKERDLPNALFYSKKACSMKDATGCRQVGLLLFSEAYTLASPKKAEQAYNYFNQACELGNEPSCREYKNYPEKMAQFRRWINSKDESLAGLPY